MVELKPLKLKVNGKSQIALPENLHQELRCDQIGSEIEAEFNQDGLLLKYSINHLSKIYIEPTNTCNLTCRTCMRNVWNEPSGFMNSMTFEKILRGIKEFKHTPSIFLGGFGEPLAHPDIIPMIKAGKQLGCEVEMITNGTALTREISKRLIDAGLDRLWVSLDGARPESYMDIRLGASLPYVIEQLQILRTICTRVNKPKPEIGIAFVAMRRNIAELPALLRLAVELGASRFSMSNVLAHTPELREEILYERSIFDGVFQSSCYRLQVDLPRMDINDLTRDPLVEMLRGAYRFTLGGDGLGGTINRCPFIHKRSISIRWDGKISPCLPLLHSYVSFLEDRERRSNAFFCGDLVKKSLKKIWQDKEYTQLRKRLRDFDFSPCVFCNSCEMAGENREDCFGNSDPTCGGCLWAQGLIQCP